MIETCGPFSKPAHADQKRSSTEVAAEQTLNDEVHPDIIEQASRYAESPRKQGGGTGRFDFKVFVDSLLQKTSGQEANPEDP